MTGWISAAAAALLVIPLIALRARALRRCYALIFVLLVAAFALSRQLAGWDPYLGLAAVSVAALSIFSIVLATANAEDVRWSATRAAVIAGIVYALVIPAMLRVPIDGDEPYYLLLTESLVHDRDFDLANQYRDIAHSQAGRPDLGPLPGDPRGPHGEQYSRHEPLLAIVLIPGFLIAGLPGAVATIALFAMLMVRSTVRFLEDEGIEEEVARSVFPFLAFAPPVLFYASRIWPEVPAAFLFVEAVRGVRQHRPQRWLPSMAALVTLKLRFILAALPLLLRLGWRRRRNLAIGAVVIAIPLLIVWAISGSATNVHSWRELLPGGPLAYATGFFGLLLDGGAGVLFQAPFLILGVFAMARWRSMPEGFRTGCLGAALYVFYLVPRAEWHGGWSPPLRYLVVFVPLLTLGAASIWRRVPAGIIALMGVWTAGLAIHGLAYPWRLFHIADGENLAGEALSRIWHSDFSRLFPSFIRTNQAAWVTAAVFVVLLLIFALVRHVALPSQVLIALATAGVAAMFVYGLRPGRVVEFEDAHVIHRGGELYPKQYTVSRFLYSGSWRIGSGDTMSFLAQRGPATLRYMAPQPVLIEVAGLAYPLPATGTSWGKIAMTVPRTGRIELRCVHGTAILDRIESR